MRTFGELEGRIMRVVWQRAAPATVRDVHGELARERPLAYTTVMTVMERLWRKGVLDRTPRGRAFEYSPVQTEAEHTAELMAEVLKGTRDRHAALAHFVGGLRKSDGDQLLDLAERARSRRRAR